MNHFFRILRVLLFLPALNAFTQTSCEIKDYLREDLVARALCAPVIVRGMVIKHEEFGLLISPDHYTRGLGNKGMLSLKVNDNPDRLAAYHRNFPLSASVLLFGDCKDSVCELYFKEYNPHGEYIDGRLGWWTDPLINMDRLSDTEVLTLQRSIDDVLEISKSQGPAENSRKLIEMLHRDNRHESTTAIRLFQGFSQDIARVIPISIFDTAVLMNHVMSLFQDVETRKKTDQSIKHILYEFALNFGSAKDARNLIGYCDEDYRFAMMIHKYMNKKYDDFSHRRIKLPELMENQGDKSIENGKSMCHIIQDWLNKDDEAMKRTSSQSIASSPRQSP